MSPKPTVSNGQPGDRKPIFPNLKALRAIDPKEWLYVRSHTGKWSKTKAVLKDLPAHGGARRGMAKGKRSAKATAKAKAKTRCPTQHRASAERPRSMAAQPKAQKVIPELPNRGWRLTNVPSFLISLPADVDRRHASLHELNAIGFRLRGNLACQIGRTRLDMG